MPGDDGKLKVVHVLDAAGGSEQLWGKERVVHWLALEQQQSGDLSPSIRTLTPKRLTEVALQDGLDADALHDRVTKSFSLYIAALREHCRQFPDSVVHTHGYKANLIGRAARWAGVPMAGLVATCHGWVDTTLGLRLYNTLDRWTSRFSDATTVPASNMLSRLPRAATFIPNGVPDGPEPTAEDCRAARAELGLPTDRVIAGVLGRLSPEKGIDTLLDAVRATRGREDLLWVVAGTGPLESMVQAAERELPNLKFVGYVEGSKVFLPAIDIFVQPSWSEGLSLSLIEAARAGRAIVATRVGATEWAVRDPAEAVLIEPGESQQLANFVVRLAEDENWRRTLGRSARQRFEEALNVAAMHRRYLDLYRDIVVRRGNVPPKAVAGAAW